MGAHASSRKTTVKKAETKNTVRKAPKKGLQRTSSNTNKDAPTGSAGGPASDRSKGGAEGRQRPHGHRLKAQRPLTETAPSLREAPRRRPAQANTPNEETPSRSSQPKKTRSEKSPAKATGQEPPTDSRPEDSRFAEHYHHNSMDLDMLGIGSPVFPPGGFTLDAEEDDVNGLDDTQEMGTAWADDPTVEMRIREIEERLDGLMASEPHEDLDRGPAAAATSMAAATADTAVDAAREILESDYYRRKWGRTSLRERANEIDEFGMDPSYEEKLRPALDFMFKSYFRVEVDGIRNVPAEGRAVVVANHSGALPFDGVMLREAIRQRHPGRADLRWLAEDFSFYLPFLGVTLNRLGAVRACPENAERLLSKEHLVGVFPEGAEGIKKLYRDRYRLQRFGRGGFVRLCLKTQSPIIPCAIVGAEETNPILYRFDNLSKLLGLDYLPITPTFPLLGPLGLLPAPTKWRIIFGEPISVEEYGPQAAQDHVLVGRLSERVRASINDLLETALRRRKSIWL